MNRRWCVRDYEVEVDRSGGLEEDDGHLLSLLLAGRDPDVRRALSEIVREVTGGMSAPHESGWEEELSFAAYAGMLRVERRARTGIATMVEDDPGSFADADVLGTQTVSAWVGISLVDQDGEPVPGARYRLTLPDGSVKEGSLGSSGSATVQGIAPGSCKVEFPDFRSEDWKAA